MKQCFFILLLCLPVLCAAQKKTNKSGAPKKDRVEMKQYYFVMLTKGPKRDEITDTAILNKIQAGHMENITRLHNMGKLMVAGPFGDDGNWRGIFILDAASEEEAKALLATDPAIAAGRLGYEIHPWWTAKNSVFK